MDTNLTLFFEKMPGTLPLYFAFKERVCTQLTDVKIKIQKTQITFTNKHNFAAVWLPIRKMKNRPDTYIVVTFFLPNRINSPRIVSAVEPYPSRWTHHVVVERTEEIDDELMEWIAASYNFALQK